MNAISPSRMRGFSLLEILITMLVVSVGLMGMAGVISRVHVAGFEAYQRSQALIILDEIVQHLNVNRNTLSCFRFTTNLTNGTPYIGVDGTVTLPVGCAAGTIWQYNDLADTTIQALQDRLLGSAETKAGASVRPMIGARACISYDAASELSDSVGALISGTGLYTITVAWQGMAATQAPTAACANNLYGSSDAWRRAVTTTVRFANLTAASLATHAGAGT
ncbi:MAG: prepilin-type N-terminal cleavage/methylation domain-containing protein [Magnetococcales bacterium]|nr:prepilin-type N-terminal cleavage/methylation domain-containing protein [Magnetococcales bacterium]